MTRPAARASLAFTFSHSEISRTRPPLLPVNRRGSRAFAQCTRRSWRRRTSFPRRPLAWGERPEPETVADEPLSSAFGHGGHFEEPSAFGFGGLMLSDEDFDAPVYRSLSFASEGSDAPFGFGVAEDEGSPSAVYRSLSGPQRANSARRAAPLTEEEADRAWLETMPPLIKRQKAHHVSAIGM